MAESEIVYQHGIVPRWAWIVCWSILAALALVMPVVLPADGDVPFVVDALVYAGVWGIPVWVALLALWSVNRYGKITVTSDELRVGRNTVAVAEIERSSVLLLARDTPGVWSRIATSSGQIDWEAARLRTTGDARLLGGGVATPIGADSVTLGLRRGGPVLIPTTDRAGLIDALLRVVPADGPPGV